MTNASELAPMDTCDEAIEPSIQDLLERMTLEEKVGQMQQVDATGDTVSADLRQLVVSGAIGSVINHSNVHIANELQRLAVEESRLGIPLLAGRDVIHGYKTVLPIPLGLAASWDPDLVQAGAALAARESSQNGVNWTFAPMIDVSRDARWGRIAESFGEDPYLSGVMGAAMTRGFQGDDLSHPNSIAACAKHFAGYGASESGRDYNTTNIPENELRNVYLPPFKAVLDAGVATFMASFGDLDGIPATANEFLMKQILRTEWGFDGMVVSDWDSVRQISVHGLTENDREATVQAVTAGIDMEMAGGAYTDHLASLVREGRFAVEDIDRMVSNILRTKFRLGLFDAPYTESARPRQFGTPQALSLAKDSAMKSIVLLKNANSVLPLDPGQLSSIALVGPMADVPSEQIGTWVFDGDEELSVTPLQAIESELGDDVTVHYAPALKSSLDRETDGFEEALNAASGSEYVIVCVGEDAILSGEAHCRADINLPGAQVELVRKLKQTGKSLIAVVMAGRPLTLENILEHCDAVLYAWHPGSMAGPAISDLLFGKASPSGRLPVSFPKMVGQIPIYYNQKNTGRPPTPDTVSHIDDIKPGAKQTSLGMTAFHFDAGYKPRFPFGFGLGYTTFEYGDLGLSANSIGFGETLRVSATITNTGDVTATETVQLYVRDLVGSVTRPVRELKGFQKHTLAPGQSVIAMFELTDSDLAFSRRDKTFGAEPGQFDVWVGENSEEGLQGRFELVQR